jgi:SAM-dependent methyltransferase
VTLADASGPRISPRYVWAVNGVEAVASLGDWPSDGLEPVAQCPVCGASARRTLHEGLTDRTYRCAPGQWRFVACDGCGTAYLDPRPDERTVDLAYVNYYGGAHANRPAGDEVPAGWRRLRRTIRNGYLNGRYGYRLTPASRLGQVLVPFVPGQRERADEYIRHLAAPRGAARLLDVGCGEGEFLSVMQALGWSVTGIEPSEQAAEIARSRGISVEQTTFARASLPDELFDAVTMRLVLEHLAEPAAALATCRRALRRGGILSLATPSLDAEAHRSFGSDWIFLDPPRHPVLHRLSALSDLLRRLRFEIGAVRPLRNAGWSFRLSAAVAQGLPPYSRPPALSRSLALRARLADAKALRRPELADIVVVIARKR